MAQTLPPFIRSPDATAYLPLSYLKRKVVSGLNNKAKPSKAQDTYCDHGVSLTINNGIKPASSHNNTEWVLTE